MTRILTITSGLGVGGAETMLVQLAQALSARGHAQEVVNLSSQRDLAGRLEAAGVPVRDLGLRSPGGALPAAVKLRRIVAAFAPDVIQGWMYHGNLAASLAHAVSPARGGRRLYWGLRASNMDSGRYGGIIRIGALLSRFTDAVIANSQAGAAFHVAQGFSPATMRVIANGVDTAKFKPDEVVRAEVRHELSFDAARPLAICVARVDPMKDPPACSKPWPRFPCSISCWLAPAPTRCRCRQMPARSAGAATSRGSMPLPISWCRRRPSAKASPTPWRRA